MRTDKFRKLLEVSMFIEFHIDGMNQPQLVSVGPKASKFALELEKRGKKFKLGKTHN